MAGVEGIPALRLPGTEQRGQRHPNPRTQGRAGSPADLAGHRSTDGAVTSLIPEEAARSASKRAVSERTAANGSSPKLPPTPVAPASSPAAPCTRCAPVAALR